MHRTGIVISSKNNPIRKSKTERNECSGYLERNNLFKEIIKNLNK